MPNELTSADLTLLLGSWERSLRAERKSEETLKSYGDGVRAYLTWAEANDLGADLSRAQVRGFLRPDDWLGDLRTVCTKARPDRSRPPHHR